MKPENKRLIVISDWPVNKKRKELDHPIALRINSIRQISCTVRVLSICKKCIGSTCFVIDIWHVMNLIFLIFFYFNNNPYSKLMFFHKNVINNIRILFLKLQKNQTLNYLNILNLLAKKSLLIHQIMTYFMFILNYIYSIK